MDEFEEATCFDIDGAHVYETPSGKRYPSITTILDRTKSERSKDLLRRWIKDVGKEEANRIRDRAGKIGSFVHKMNEDYLRHGNPGNDGGKYFPAAHIHHAKFRPYIDKIEHTYGIEVKMYSDKHSIAGMADVVCRYDGLDTVLDYKTKRKEQYEELVSDYYIQTTAYGIMYEELASRKIKQLVVLCSVEGTDTVHEFRSDPELWKHRLFERLDSFDPATVRMHDDTVQNYVSGQIQSNQCMQDHPD